MNTNTTQVIATTNQRKLEKKVIETCRKTKMKRVEIQTIEVHGIWSKVFDEASLVLVKLQFPNFMK
jgi:hypothetical protein